MLRSLSAMALRSASLRACASAGVPGLRAGAGVTAMATRGDKSAVDSAAGRVRNLTTGEELDVPPLPEVMREIIAAGGGIGYMRRRLGIDAAAPS